MLGDAGSPVVHAASAAPAIKERTNTNELLELFTRLFVFIVQLVEARFVRSIPGGVSSRKPRFVETSRWTARRSLDERRTVGEPDPRPRRSLELDRSWSMYAIV